MKNMSVPQSEVGIAEVLYVHERATRLWFFSALALFFLLLSLTYLMRPIIDPDFFWHLKTGEWIWQHKALLESDPFSFTGPQQPNSRQLVILQGYWLAQVTYYAIVTIGGLWGIFLLRVVLFALFFGFFIWVFERHCVNRLLSFSLLALFSIFFLENYPLERPQVFTFLAIPLLLILYRRLRDDRSGTSSTAVTMIAVFLLMAVWGNMHGGVILGQAVIGVMLVVESVSVLRTRDYGRIRKMLVFGAVALTGSFLAPSHLSLGDFFSLVGTGVSSFGYSQSQTNYEYYSVYKWLVVNKNFKLLIPVALCVTCIAFLKQALTRGNYLEIVLLVIFWIFAFRHVRYLPIAMVFSLLFVAWNYRQDSLLNYGVVPLFLGFLCSLWLWTSNEFHHFERARGQGLIDPLNMPVRAADYLQQVGFKGRIFNNINWGGYLLWRLSPDVQVATDSRLLDESVAMEMRRCETDGKGESGGPYWKDVMSKYAINVAVLPLANGASPTQLALSLAGDADWKLVFRDRISAVYVRKLAWLTVPNTLSR